MIVTLCPVVVAVITGQLHRAEPGDPGDIGQDEDGQDEQPEFGAAGAAGKSGIVPEGAFEKRTKICKCHDEAVICEG